MAVVLLAVHAFVILKVGVEEWRWREVWSDVDGGCYLGRTWIAMVLLSLGLAVAALAVVTALI